MSEWPVGIIVAGVAALLLFACLFRRRPQSVRHGGRVYYRQPDGSFTDSEKRPVTDGELAAILGGIVAATPSASADSSGSSGTP